MQRVGVPELPFKGERAPPLIVIRNERGGRRRRRVFVVQMCLRQRRLDRKFPSCVSALPPSLARSGVSPSLFLRARAASPSFPSSTGVDVAAAEKQLFTVALLPSSFISAAWRLGRAIVTCVVWSQSRLLLSASKDARRGVRRRPCACAIKCPPLPSRRGTSYQEHGHGRREGRGGTQRQGAGGRAAELLCITMMLMSVAVSPELCSFNDGGRNGTERNAWL